MFWHKSQTSSSEYIENTVQNQRFVNKRSPWSSLPHLTPYWDILFQSIGHIACTVRTVFEQIFARIFCRSWISRFQVVSQLSIRDCGWGSSWCWGLRKHIWKNLEIDDYFLFCGVALRTAKTERLLKYKYWLTLLYFKS